MFEEHWGEYDCFVGLMASGIAMRKTAGLLDDKWEDPAVVVVDEELTWAIPLTGGHHGANQVAYDLSKLGAVPAMTTASEAAGKQGVESKAKALDAHVVNGDSTVATNLAVLDDELGPIERLDGPKAVLVDDDVTVLKRNKDDGIVLGCGSVAGADVERATRPGSRRWTRPTSTATKWTSSQRVPGKPTRKACSPPPRNRRGRRLLREGDAHRVRRSDPLAVERTHRVAGHRRGVAPSPPAANTTSRRETRYDAAVTVAIGR